MNLSGLSATYPGYMAAEDLSARTGLNQTRQRDAAIRMLGQQVAGSALAGGSPGPQAPPPGQASVPNKPAVPLPQPRPPEIGGPPPQAAPPVAPPAAPMASGIPQTKMPLGDAVQRILSTAPGVANHPEVLLSALSHLNNLGLLDPEAQAKVEEASKMHTVARVKAAKDHLEAVSSPAAASPPAPAARPTATNPQTGAKLEWDGKAWQPIPTAQ